MKYILYLHLLIIIYYNKKKYSVYSLVYNMLSPRPFRQDDIYRFVKNNDIQSLEQHKKDLKYLIRDEKQLTPLAACIKNGNDMKSTNETLKYILKDGAASSVFVKGYAKDSIVCTLPMAIQPISSVYQWPDPIKVDDDVLSIIDAGLSSYIQSLSDKSKAEKAASSSASINIAPNAPNAPNAPLTPPFNHFPSTLKVGNRVRRGPNWSYGSQDTYNNIQCEGIVQTFSGNTCQIEWLENPQDLNSGFNTYGYYFDSQSNRFDVFLVNPADPTAVPSNVGAINKSTAPPANDSFKIGDKVQLKDNISRSSLVSSSNSAMLKISKNCLDKSSEGHVGVIVSKSDEKKHMADSNKPTEYTTHVMALHSGGIMEYSIQDLCYADGSMPSIFTDIPRPIHDDPKYSHTSANLKVGDRVRIKPNAKDRRGCLFEHWANFVGTISTDHGNNKTLDVSCNDARLAGNSHIASQISGRYPIHSYHRKDLMSEFGNVEYLPLLAGDIVELDSKFSEPSGWCLGNPSEKKKGIVRFAPVMTKGEQRDIYVSSLDNPKEMFSFRSTWLNRVPNKGENVFKVGDRVSLDIGNWNPRSSVYAGKCLGSAKIRNYGLIVDIGPKRDDIQRNIAVVACSGERKGQLSLYPAFSLVTATRVTTVTDNDNVALIAEVDSLFKKYDLPSIDAAVEVKAQGLSIWSFLLSLVVIPKKVIEQSFRRWDSSRSFEWPCDEVNMKSPIEIPISNEDAPTHWRCTNSKCKSIGINSYIVIIITIILLLLLLLLLRWI